MATPAGHTGDRRFKENGKRKLRRLEEAVSQQRQGHKNTHITHLTWISVADKTVRVVAKKGISVKC